MAARIVIVGGGFAGLAVARRLEKRRDGAGAELRLVCPTDAMLFLREHGRGMKTLAEAAVLRDHILAQLEISAASTEADERDRRCRFVVVGGGYAGVETTAQLHLMTRELAARFPRLNPATVPWHLIQHGDQLLPHLDAHLGRRTHTVLTRRGITVHLDTSLERVDPGSVTLTGGRRLVTRTVIWTAGVAPNPLINHLDQPTQDGRLVVGADLAVPGHPDVPAHRPVRRPPDPDRCGRHRRRARRRAYPALPPARLGTVSTSAAVKPWPHHSGSACPDFGAHLITRGYRLWSVRAPDAMRRAAANWALHAAGGHDPVRLGFRTTAPGSSSSSSTPMTTSPAHKARHAVNGPATRSVT